MNKLLRRQKSKLLRRQKMSEDACLTKQAVYREQVQTLKRLITRLDRECGDLMTEWIRDEDVGLSAFMSKWHNLKTAQAELDRITELLGENWT